MAMKLLRSVRLLGSGLAFVLVCSLVCPQLEARAEPDFPTLTGRVVDGADLLSAAEEAVLTGDLKRLEDETSDQLVVVTLPSLQGYAIEDFGYRLGRHWGIGTAELNNGVLLIVAPKERKVRIEVGYGLEPVLTDALSRVIIDNAILPRFRSRDFAAGIKDGVRDITAVLKGDAEAVKARAKTRRDADDGVGKWITFLIVVLWIAISLFGGTTGGGRSRSGGGGFSGGGGSFGGGGSSGRW